MYGRLVTFAFETPSNMSVASHDRTSAARRKVKWEKSLIDRIVEWQASQNL
jgi:hypothetical protein